MLLRWLIHSALRTAAEKKIRSTVSDAVQESIQAAGRTTQSISLPPDQQQAPSEQAAPNDAPAEPPPPCQIAFVFALGIESGGFVDQLSKVRSTKRSAYLEHYGLLGDRPVAIAESGVGRSAAAKAVRELIELHHPTWVVATGFAGALRQDLKRGHILMADVVAGETGEDLAVGMKLDAKTLAASKGLHVGKLLTVDRLIRHRQERLELGREHQAAACDMESSAIAEVCAETKTRFLCVRIISDGVEDELPPEVETLLEQKSIAGKLGAAAGAIFHRPAMVKDLWKLRDQARKTSDRLATFLVGVADQLS